MTLRGDAGRYEPGTLNVIGSFGLRASIELLLEAGVERISEAILAVTDRLAEGARERGYEILGERKPAHAAGIVCIRKPGLDARLVHARLREQGILGAPRQGWVRLSPHFYISSEDAEQVIAALP
jgi:selenocysteine lyase/cysteine desulfurase